ncbi:hypothetical protein GS966_02475 [Rhodococcus hoagii]|nr:hypothetical protein [Prescottella equi]NKZ88793.1 hypothetical protein [Prescottella equi]
MTGVHSTPRSVLFLSVDLVGSTKYKQQTDDWQRAFLSFYREFPQQLAAEIGTRRLSIAPKLWKPVGDELIFRVDVLRESDVLDAIECWLAAMHEYEQSSLANLSLSTKGGAFIATFPGPDSEVAVPIDPSTEQSDKTPELLNEEALAKRDRDRYLYDYFGPSIDTGFRVVSACTERYFTLSLEVAWTLSRAALATNLGQYNGLVFRKSHEFKGVWNGREYPLFAIDRQISDPVHEALRSLDGDTHASAENIETLARACGKSGNWPFCVYLPDSQQAAFNIAPTLPERISQNAMEGSEIYVEDEGGKSLSEDAVIT